MSDTSSRFYLHQLPLAARLVLTVFLIAVGLGYFSAMVQLHLQHSSRKGEHLPTPDDVIEKFSGLKKSNGEKHRPQSKIEFLISGAKEGELTKDTMAPAFFGKSGSKFEKEVKSRGKEAVEAEREGERLGLKAWIDLPSENRKKFYEEDAFVWEGATDAVTEEFFEKETKTLKIKSLFEARCLRCHGGDTAPDLSEFTALEKFLYTPPADEVLPGGWVRSSRQMSVETLTQSTHAHLLSFAVLFTLTGLLFSLTTYPGLIRGILAPIVLVAQVADISCWWLARMDGIGHYFALAIIGTGTVVGLGLVLQIFLTLFNMYGIKGKVILFLLIVLGLTGFGALYTKAIAPGLEAEKRAAIAEVK
jgi:hypothetical protein